MRRIATIAGCAAMLAGGDTLAQPAHAQTTAPAPVQRQPDAAAAFHAEITRTYARDRTAPDRRANMDSVSRSLDAFWNRVKGDKATFLPLLRAELLRPDNPPFFYFDGAELLRDASDNRADLELALSVIERVDLSQVDLGGYLIAISFYASHGFDTRRAAFRWLELPRDTDIIVQPLPHTFHYSIFEALIFSLFAMDEERFVGDLIARLEATRDDQQATYLLIAIWSTATNEGRRAIGAFSEDQARPEAGRRFAREMLAYRGEGPAPTRTEAELRQARRDIVADPFVHDSFEHFREVTNELVRVTAAAGTPPPVTGTATP